MVGPLGSPPRGVPKSQKTTEAPKQSLQTSLSLFHFQIRKQKTGEPEKKRFGIFFCLFISEMLMENAPLAMGRVR